MRCPYNDLTSVLTFPQKRPRSFPSPYVAKGNARARPRLLAISSVRDRTDALSGRQRRGGSGSTRLLALEAAGKVIVNAPGDVSSYTHLSVWTKPGTG